MRVDLLRRIRAIAAQHRFPSLQVGIGVVSAMLAHPQMYSVVAEVDDRVVGSNFPDERRHSEVLTLTHDLERRRSG